NGRYVVFTSDATNLVAGESHVLGDIFVKDLQTGTTTRITDGQPVFGQLAISANGQYIVFGAEDSPIPASGQYDIYRKDMIGGSLTPILIPSHGNQPDGVSLSADGRYLFFTSADDTFVSGDTNQYGDAFVKDLQTGTIARISLGTAGAQLNAS